MPLSQRLRLMRRIERYGARTREMMSKKGGDGTWSWSEYDIGYVAYGHGASRDDSDGPDADADPTPTYREGDT